MADEKGFYWQRFIAVEEMFLSAIDAFKQSNGALAAFEKKLLSRTSTRLLDWVDHLILPDTDQVLERLNTLGFIRQPAVEVQAYNNPGVMLPRVVLAGSGPGVRPGVALRVENIADFLQVHTMHAKIEGSPYSPYRRACISTENDVSIFVVERRGSRDYEPVQLPAGYLQEYFSAVETWKGRPRSGDDEDRGLTAALQIAAELADSLGQSLAAHVVCLCERDYWMSRNYAARVQKARQDTLGLGWANHDHHTFRSSRRNFAKLIHLFSLLGFEKRERFYAGKEAGWGAQVMENTTAGCVLFLDVDLDSEEVEVDFTTQTLPEKEKLGTVGLWCALHGDSILQAGMHHLAAQFEFDRITEDIAQYGVNFMSPFSNFSYLKQAFSIAEQWKPDQAQIQKLLDEKAIDSRQAEKFLNQGAVGSHIENIQRREGYKGFNKKNVSAIIKAVDPRQYVGESA